MTSSAQRTGQDGRVELTDSSAIEGGPDTNAELTPVPMFYEVRGANIPALLRAFIGPGISSGQRRPVPAPEPTS